MEKNNNTEQIAPEEKLDKAPKDVFTFEKNKYRINLPATSVKEDGAWIPYTRKEVLEDTKLQKLFVEMLEKEETIFISKL